MSYYKDHVFFCTNKREDGRKCCEDANAREMRDYAKTRTKELKLARPGGVRINIAGCLNRCNEGPTIVVYPQEVWYTYHNRQDIDRIIDEHLIKGNIVTELQI